MSEPATTAPQGQTAPNSSPTQGTAVPAPRPPAPVFRDWAAI